MKENSDILLSDEFRSSVEANLERDPLRIALDGSVPHAAFVATQVKYLKRAERKLPSYYQARCILPPRAFEQSSSETTAARKEYSGRLAVDLTCGLGVDSLYLSRRFDRVIALERDPLLAAVARENFRRLGADNIEVVNVSAEESLSDTEVSAGFCADLVYADPDRRSSTGRKLVRIEDCSPDVAALLPQIEKIAPRLVVKLSPLFDVDEVFRVFGPSTRVEVVSVGGECREIIADISFRPRVGPSIHAVATGFGEAEFPAHTDPQAYPDPHAYADTGLIPVRPFEPEKYHWLVVPDVALQKARLARRYFSERGGSADDAIWIESDNGYGFAVRRPENIMGKVFEIESVEPFDPKSLKRRLDARGVKGLDIMKRNFPLASADLVRRLGVREGGKTVVAFTGAAGKLWQIILRATPV